MKVLELKSLIYERNTTRRNCPILTINARSLDHWSHRELKNTSDYFGKIFNLCRTQAAF